MLLGLGIAGACSGLVVPLCSTKQSQNLPRLAGPRLTHRACWDPRTSALAAATRWEVEARQRGPGEELGCDW